MGMCKGCNKVFNVIEMKNGLCETCRTSSPHLSISQNSYEHAQKSNYTPMDKLFNFFSITFMVLAIGSLIVGGVIILYGVFFVK